jgi:hypothetical protein
MFSDIGFLYLPTFAAHMFGIGFVVYLTSRKPHWQWALLHSAIFGTVLACILFAIVNTYAMACDCD